MVTWEERSRRSTEARLFGDGFDDGLRGMLKRSDNWHYCRGYADGTIGRKYKSTEQQGERRQDNWN